MAKTTTFIILICIVNILLSGCASMTLDKHDEKYENLSVAELLDPNKNSPQKKDELEQTYLSRAKNSLKERHYQQANQYANMAKNLTNDNPEADLILAEVLLSQGHFVQAETMFRELAKKNNTGKAHQGIGLSLLMQKNHPQAQKELNTALALNPLLWRAWNSIGMSHAFQSNWELAEQAYLAALSISSEKMEIYNNLGLLYMRQDRFKEALTTFDKARTLPKGKQSVDANYRLAMALKGNLAQAKTDATDVELAQLYNSLGIRAYEKGEKIKAIKFLKKAIAQNPSYYPQANKNLELAQALDQ